MNKLVTIKYRIMTVNDIKDVQILVNLKDGQKLISVTDEPFVLFAIASFVKFVKVDETKFGSMPLKEIL